MISVKLLLFFHSIYRLVLHAIHYKNPQFDNIVYISKMYQKAITSIFYTFPIGFENDYTNVEQIKERRSHAPETKPSIIKTIWEMLDSLGELSMVKASQNKEIQKEKQKRFARRNAGC